MTHRILLTRRAERDLDNLDPPVRDRIIATLRRFAESGHGDVKKLKGEASRWRLRAGGWRILFTFDKAGDALVVLRVVPRGKAYR